MCEWNKWGDTRIDPCMREKIVLLNKRGIKTLACCCGHGIYPETIMIKQDDKNVVKLNSSIGIIIPRKRRRYLESARVCKNN